MTRAARLGIVALAIAGGAALVASTFVAAPLDAPEPYAGDWPAASPPESMRIYAITTGVTHRSADFAYRGGSLLEPRDFAMAATLVTHPRGDVLIDAGFGRRLDAQFATMPWWFRLTTRYTRGRSAAEQLDAAGYDRGRLKAVLLTHAHWDHVSGLPELPGATVLVPEEEARFVRDGGWITEVARGDGVRLRTYAFDGGPYLGFERSHDVHGDGSVVAVPAPGHTPGSVIVFITLPDGARYALIGDLAWQLEGVLEREERPFLQRALADDDPALTRRALLRVNALARRFPGLRIVPAHDARAFARMPPLSVMDTK